MKPKFLSSIKNQITLIITASIVITMVMALIFYGLSVSAMKNEHSQVVTSLLSHASENISSHIDEMKYISDSIANNDTVRSMLTSDEPLEKYEYGQTLSIFESNLLQYSTFISHILIVTPDCSIFSATQHNVLAVDTLDREYGIFSSENTSSGVIAPVTNAADNIPYVLYYTPVYRTSGSQRQLKIGTVLILSPVSTITRILDSAISFDDCAILLYNAGNTAFTGSGSTQLYSMISSGDVMPSAGRSTFGNDKCNISVLGIEGTGWTLVFADSGSSYSSDLMPLLYQGLFTSLLFIIMAVVWNVHLRRSIARPIQYMIDFIGHDIDSDLTHRLPEVHNNHEIGIIYNQINHMLDVISDSTRELMHKQSEVYELSLAKNKAELQALQSQINPHFLYNTLDCIKGYGYLLNCSEIVTISNSLAAIMRYCIKGPDFVSVTRELSVVRDYLSIISIRFCNRFATSIETDPATENAVIPRFILQPLVENAVYHGLEPRNGPGRLEISSKYIEPGHIRFTIKDDGVGMDADVLSQLRARLDDWEHSVSGVSQSFGIALPNIQSRIKRIYGAEYGLSIESRTDAGTTVTLEIPLREEKHDQLQKA